MCIPPFPNVRMRSGDIGKVDADGFLYIMDRKKDLIIRGGENISCSEIEAAIYEHPDVAEAAAFGIADARLGEIVSACFIDRVCLLAQLFTKLLACVFQVGLAVVMKPGARPLTLDTCTTFLKKSNKLAPFKYPSAVFVWHEPNLPRGATGKIVKKDIRQYYADRLKAANTKPVSKL